ncbi:MAG: tRNA pseudouridine(13) synthase TruD [Phycisphaerae bacterium]|nr:tRNA pseudouridine(13) synthase TruD [Phycisphaerae bacterium]
MSIRPVAYVTADLPGTGGRIKERPEDFVVTELPLYEPSGRGEHVYLLVEKRGVGSLEAADRIARTFGLPRRWVGLAGLKDAQSVSRQWMSLQGIDPEKAAHLEWPDLRVLRVGRHRNKLKIGHLAGNRFEVRLRGCAAGAEELARAILARLSSAGVPNWFDEQRFGRRSDNHLLGRALVLGDARGFCDRFLGGPSPADSPRLQEARRRYDTADLAGAKKKFGGEREHLKVLSTLLRTKKPSRAARAVSKQLARLFVSACQSALFNDVLARRLEDLAHVEAGDLAYLHAKGAVFLVQNVEQEQPRADRFELSPSGPIVGHRVRLAEGRPGEIERAVLAASGIGPEDFTRVKALRLRGGRRPLRIPLADVRLEPDGEDLLLAFTLPPGAYATVVLAEITKSPT